jgi:hypothetical protein
MNANSQRYALMASALAMSLQGCAGASRDKPQASFDLRPSQTAAPAMSLSDARYADAAAAISRGDYARALDLLQAARARSGDDARILNAFGVIYDKLGRFDLSQRYYSRAQALDPASRIVAQNLVYSQILQGRSAPVALAATEASATPGDRAPAPAPAPLADARERPALADARDAPLAMATPAQALSLAVPVVASSPITIAAAEPPVVALAVTGPVLLRAPPPEQPAAVEAPAPSQAASNLLPPVVLPRATPVRAAHAAAPTEHRLIPAQLQATAGPAKPAPVLRVADVATPVLAPAPKAAPAAAYVVRTAVAAAAQPAAAKPPGPKRPSAAVKIAVAPPASPIARPSKPASLPLARSPSVGRAVVADVRSSKPNAAHLHTQPAWRGWTLAAVNARIAQTFANGLRMLVNLQHCGTGCSRVTVPLNGKHQLHTAGSTAGGPARLG